MNANIPKYNRKRVMIKYIYTLHSVLQDTKEKIQKIKDYQERLMESLGDILEKHLPLPQNESSSNKKKKVGLVTVLLQPVSI